MSELFFCGDPHGRFRQINDAAADYAPAAMILLGDYDLTRPLELELQPALEHTEIHWIPGNHDFDSETAFDALFGSALAERNLHGRVVEIGGLRVAGLGGTFHGKVWNPREADPEPQFRTRTEFEKRMGKGNRWRGGLPLKRRGAIWYEDIARLRRERADVLVTHEAPGCHPLGFPVLDELARAMGVRTIVHGHHHTPYTVRYRRGDLTVHGVGLAGVSTLEGEIVVPGTEDGEGSARLHQMRTRAKTPWPDQLP